MKITALALFAASLVAASPVVKRQSVVESAVSSAVASVTSQVVGSASSAVASASGAASSATPSQDFGAGLLAALRARQATTLATLLEPLAGTLGPVLSQGQWTIMAPGDAELAAVPASVTGNMTLLTEILSYHLVAGNYPAAGLVENQTVIAPTFLTNNMMGANNTQFPLAFAQDVFGTTNIIGQNASVVANSTYQNVLIKLINGVLIPPSNVTSVLSANGGDALVGALTSLLPQVAQAVDTTQGITLFAPDNESVSAAASTLAGLAQSMPDAVSSAVQGHVVPQVLFSSNITDGAQVTSLAGTPLSFIANATGAFVTGNGVTAQITTPDLIASNGVVHIIDALLFSPPASSPSSMASSGMMSATQAAGGVVSSASAAVGGAASSATGAVGGALSSATAAVASAVPSV